MKLLRNIMAISVTVVMALSVVTSVAYADENSARIIINNESALNFDELVIVEGGKTYIPIRLAFPNLNDKELKLGMKLVWGTDYPVVRLVYGTTDGGSIVVSADGTQAPPFSGKRKCIDIMWDGNAENGAKAYLSIVDYSEVVNGVPTNPEINDEYALDDPIYMKNLSSGGSRLFISLDDASKLANLLGLDDGYRVKLYN